MSTTTPTQPASSLAILPTGPVLYRMSVDEYERIGSCSTIPGSNSSTATW